MIGSLVRAELPRAAPVIADELLVVMAAGQEPPAIALTRLLDRLARAPALQEAFADPGARGPVVRETLRLHPPVLAVLRRLAAPREVAGHRLPAGVVVVLPLPLLHRDPRAFADPDVFRPDRWSGAPAPAGPFAPFGDGARRCVGERLTSAYVDCLVPAVLRRVRLRAVWPRPERMVLRGTVLPPHRSGLAVATLGGPAPPEDA